MENAFGFLVSRIRVLKSEINMQPQNFEKLVLACCALHHFHKRNNSATYTPPGSIDVENPVIHETQDGFRTNENLVAVARRAMTNALERAKMATDMVKDYFNKEGAVSWQEKCLYR